MTPRRILLGLILTVACAENAVGPGDHATVQLLQADPGAPATVSFSIDEAVVATSVAFGYSSPEVVTSAGTHQLAIESLSGPVATLQGELRAGKRYYLVSAGGALTLAESGAIDSSGYTIPADTGQRNPDRANLRFVNVPGEVIEQPTVISLRLASPATVDSTAVFGLDTRVASYSSLIYLNPGAVTIRLTPQGLPTVLTETSFTVAAGEVKDVIIERDPAGALRLRVVLEQ
jgi:hypothetical protein